MQKLSFLLKLTLVIALVAFIGCQDRSNIREPQGPSLSTGPLGLPGVSLDSAIFSIYVSTAQGQTVNVHRVTAPWAEMGVTYSNFAGAYDPAVVGSFLVNSRRCERADVYSLG